MLQRNSTRVRTCLASAAKSHERAVAAGDPEMKQFFEKMEASWMRLAASIAQVERVKLFLQHAPLDGAAFDRTTADRCWRCRGPMRLKLVDVSRDDERHTFECLQCGFEHVRGMAH